MSWESRLHSSVRHGNFEAVKKLLGDENINSRNESGYTPLNVASYCGYVEIAKFLLDSGADVSKDNGEGWTPLHAACMTSRTAVVKLLLERGGGVSVNVSSGSRLQTPLIVACKSTYDRSGEIVRLLIEAGADVNFRSAQDRTPLMEATAKGFSTKVEHLLNGGAEVNAVDGMGMSALHMAVPYPKIVRLLIDSGADVNLMDLRGETPLQRRNLNCGAVTVFLEHGAGADLPCRRHKRCTGSIAKCLYAMARTSAKRGSGCEKLNAIEKYLIKLQVAGLYLGPDISLREPLELNYWNSISRGDFEVNCETEVVMMKTGKVPGINATYLDVLLQRPHALKLVDPLSLKHCREKFKIYGELIWSRFHLGRRRLPLIDECTDFFSVAEGAPYLPPECVEQILTYLPERDLRQLLSVYRSAQRRPSTPPTEPESKKRANPDSPLHVMKHLRVG